MDKVGTLCRIRKKGFRQNVPPSPKPVARMRNTCWLRNVTELNSEAADDQVRGHGSCKERRSAIETRICLDERYKFSNVCLPMTSL